LEEIDINELNKKIKNTNTNLSSLKGFEIIAENLVYKIYDVFGRNSLLSMLYQTGKGAGEIIAKRLKEKYKKNEFKLEEAIEILLGELKEFYSVQIRDIEVADNKKRIIFENRCFLREPIKHRERLKHGKSLCRINKGYFEAAFKELIGDKIKNIDINFLRNDEEKDVCVEELIFGL